MKKEGYGGFQLFKDVNFETDRKYQPHYSEKGGHKARHDFKEQAKKLKEARIPEEIIFREPDINTEHQVFPDPEQPLESQKLPENNHSVYEAQRWCYENHKRDMKKAIPHTTS